MKEILKDGRVITVKEYSIKWKITTTKNGRATSYDIQKKYYPSFEDLKEYILNEPIF